jgi:hypothetical protein
VDPSAANSAVAPVDSTGSGTSNPAPGTGQLPTSDSNSIMLSWQAPTENEDGTRLTDLKGYRIRYGTKSRDYSDSIDVKNAGLTDYVVDNLPAGQYYFALSSYNAKGGESLLSSEVSVEVD